MSRVVVTGAAGMLGRDVLAAAPDFLGISREELDVRDLDACRGAVRGADAVINCAAWTDVDGAEEREDDALAVNGEGAGNVARAAAEAGAVIVHISTDYVFDGSKREPWLESDPASPLSAYGRTKLAGEEAVAAANPRHHIVRSSWLFGAGGPNFVRTMLQLGAERDSLSVVDDQVGCPTWTAHLAPALVALAARDDFGVWHVAGGSECSWFDFAREIFARSGIEVDVEPGATADLARPAPRPAYSVLRSERKDAPELPDWREGLAGFLSEIEVEAR